MSAKNFIRLRSGAPFYFDQLRESVLNASIDDICYALAGINRFTGSSRISVAEHLCRCVRLVEQRSGRFSLCRAVLIHDVGEAFLGDVSSPLKQLLPDYRCMESIVDSAVIERFDCDFKSERMVKIIDLECLALEKEYLWDRKTSTGRISEFEIGPDRSYTNLKSEFKRLFAVE